MTCLMWVQETSWLVIDMALAWSVVRLIDTGLADSVSVWMFIWFEGHFASYSTAP